MKIITITNDKLVAKEGNISFIIFGALFMLGGLGLSLGLGTTEGIPIGFPIVFVVAFGGSGLGVILFSSSIVVTIQKNLGQITYLKKSFVKQSLDVYAISDVLKMVTRRSRNRKGDPIIQSFIVLKDGKELPIDHVQSSVQARAGNFQFERKENPAVATVASFLGVPFLETGTS